MKRLYFLLPALIFFSACAKDDTEPIEPMKETFVFQDGFETQNNILEELFPSDGSRWSTTQQVDPSIATNEISISNTKFSEGGASLYIFAYQSDSLLSKMDIEKNGLNIPSGARVNISADFYISGTNPLENLLLIDLESCSCWDPDVESIYGLKNQCPGIRLMLSGEQDYLSIERGKISGTTIHQTALSFPRNEWVSIEWEMVLSDSEDGRNILKINGTEVINEEGMNMPNAQIFSSVFANQGIEFDLQQPVYYERVQIGATANPTGSDVALYVDNFSIRVEQ